MSVRVHVAPPLTAPPPAPGIRAIGQTSWSNGYLSAAGQGKINKMLLQKASRLTDYDRDRPSARLCLTELPPAAALPLPLASKLLFCSFSPLRCLISHFSPLVPNKIVSWVGSLLQRMPVQTQRSVKPKPSELLLGVVGTTFSSESAFLRKFSSMDFPNFAKTLSSQHLLKQCESQPSVEEVRQLWVTKRIRPQSAGAGLPRPC